MAAVYLSKQISARLFGHFCAVKIHDEDKVVWQLQALLLSVLRVHDIACRSAISSVSSFK